jgi:ABC-type branched-subunit amino acid transport system substrate-binding protein
MADVRDDGSRANAVDTIDVVEIDAGDGGVDDARRAAQTINGRTDIVAVIVALPPESVLPLSTALDRSEAAILATTSPAPRPSDVDLVSSTIDEAELAGRWIGEHLDAKQPAILTSMGDITMPEVRAFEQSVKRYGRASVAQSFPFTASGGLDPLDELAAAGVDALFVVSSYARVGPALQQARIHGLDPAFVLPSAWDTADTRSLVERAGVRAYVLVPFAADDGSELARAFAAAFRDRTGAAPDAAAAAAYDALQVAVAAHAAASDPVDPRSVGDAMRGIGEVPGLSGPLAIDRQGRPRRAFVVRELFAREDAVSGRVEP